MSKFKFTGDEPVDVPSFGLVDVAPGDVVEVDGDLVGDVWEPVKSAPKKES